MDRKIVQDAASRPYAPAALRKQAQNLETPRCPKKDLNIARRTPKDCNENRPEIRFARRTGKKDHVVDWSRKMLPKLGARATCRRATKTMSPTQRTTNQLPALIRRCILQANCSR